MRRRWREDEEEMRKILGGVEEEIRVQLGWDEGEMRKTEED